MAKGQSELLVQKKNSLARARSVWLILAASAVTLSACGSGNATDAAVGDEGDAEVVYESPLGDFLGWTQGADFDEEAAQAEWAQNEREIQEAVAICMSAEGFEYIPVDTAAQNAFWEQQYEEDLEWGSKEWTERYGFGVSTQRFSQEQVGPDLVGNIYSSVSEDEGPVDPNQEYVESLGPDEQTSYYEALWGDGQGYEWDEALSEDENEAAMDDYFQSYIPTGCEPVAQEEIYNEGGQDRWQAFDTEFGEALQEMEERMESHPDVIAFRSGVRTCVEERGLEFLTDQESYEYFELALTDAGLGWDDEVDPLEGIDTTDFTDEDFNRIWEEAQSKPLPADKLAALAEVQENEIATAVALMECGGGWQNEQAALQSVRIEIEEEFLAVNADKLAEFEGVFGS